MKLYRQEGATGVDINYLNTADSIATDRGISLDEALSKVVNWEPASTAPPVRQAAVGCGTISLFVICWLLAGVVLFSDLFSFLLIRAYNSPCTGGSTYWCGHSWTIDAIIAFAVWTSIGIGLILFPILVRIATR